MSVTRLLPFRLLLLSAAIVLAHAVAFAARAEELKVTTWNLNWLTARSRAEADLPATVHLRGREDFARLATYARKLNSDVVGFQEVDGPEAAALVFDPARYTILTIDETVVQRVGLAVRHGITVHKNADYSALDVEPDAKYRLRDGLDATLTLSSGKTLRILVLHLKTGCQEDSLSHSRRAACTLLAAQTAPLAAWVAARRKEGVAFLLLGDFNRVFDRPEELSAALASAAPMLRATEGLADPCWDGDAFIDHIFAGGPARDWLEPGTLRVQIFRETDPRDRERLSDHCPVSVRLDTSR